VARVGRFGSGITVAFLAGGLVAAGAPPALAVPSAPPPTTPPPTTPPPTTPPPTTPPPTTPPPTTAPPPTIAAKSLFRSVTGDVFVRFHEGKFAHAQIHGQVTGAAKGDVAALFAQPFPFTNPPARIGSVTLTKSSQAYSFTVTPTLATHYQVELLGTGASSPPTSEQVTVYVTSFQPAAGTKKCPQTRKQPLCHQRITVTEILPASTLTDEISKHWYFYFAVNLSGTGTPPVPIFARLHARVTISKPATLAPGEFTRRVSWSFYTGVNAYAFVWATCSKDTESTDGLGLPRHHACGVKVINTRAEYIG
jgi:hypothetical protein